MADAYSVDDASLLRAIRHIEAPYAITVDAALKEFVTDSDHFEILKTNEHLRTLLKTFLEKNVAVERAKNKLSVIRSLGWLERARRRGERERLESQLLTLQAERDEAFKPYEMLRKLTDNTNNLLKRYPA